MSSSPLTIGVLRPTSLIAPRIGQQLLAGLELRLAEREGRLGGRPVRLAVEEYGTSQIIAEDRARRLLGQERADLVVGLLSVNMAAALLPLFAGSTALCLACNLGENVPRLDELHPAMVQHTLGLWQSSWALGRWAATAIGPTAVACQSFYDSGYDLPYAFRLGYESAGGSIAHALITHRPPDRGDFPPFFARAAALGPDLIFGSYCGPAATQLVRAYAASPLAGRTPLLGSGMLADESLLADQGAAAAGVRSARAWAAPGAAGPDPAFATAFEARHAFPPDVFALLGYEAGLLLDAALAATGGDARALALAPALVGDSVAGPRGPLSFDRETQSAIPPAVTVVEAQGQDGRVAQRPLARLAPPAERDPAFDELRGGLRSGWLNTYLSV